MYTYPLKLRRLTVILILIGVVIFLFTFLVSRFAQTLNPNVLLPIKNDLLTMVPEEKGCESSQKKADDVLNEYIENIELKRQPRMQQRGQYWVLYNYIRSSRTFLSHESITYTTQGDFTFLDNLEPLLERWLGPVSIALYAPGDDFQYTIDTIRYLRDCTTSLIKEYVTFHIYFQSGHFPKKIPVAEDLLIEEYNCDQSSPHLSIRSKKTYRAIKKLTYPINVARNIAKESAQTHFVLASDIELYPSANIIPNFLDMVNNSSYFEGNPVIFPLNLFEVKEGVEIPSNKTELKKMLADDTAIPFHKDVCSRCHSTPKYNLWVETPETEGLGVFHVGKRLPPFEKWESIYIGTRNDPAYDERLSWEGQSNKMTQGYILCVKNYDYMILDNAFMVHKPGIKVFKKDPERFKHVKKTDALIEEVIIKEYRILYGSKDGCVI